jgi:glucokinase
MQMLAGDIGGTKTLLRLVDSSSGTLREQRFPSRDYATFDEVVQAFLGGDPVQSACFAVAGPVVEGEASVTNLPWRIRERVLAQRFGIAQVRLVNDFFAVARGVPLLTRSDFAVINEGTCDQTKPIAIIGAGTGLGEGIVLPQKDGDFQVVASEGGHGDFAPTNEEQIEVLKFLATRHAHVSYERVVSGMGLSNLYEFVLATRKEQLPREVDDLPAHVSRLAAAGDAAATQTFGIFVDAYAAEAANLALKVLAQGGVYLAGGIAAKNLEQFTSGRFMRSFTNKGRLSELVRSFPVYVITNSQVGLIGAAALAAAQAGVAMPATTKVRH